MKISLNKTKQFITKDFSGRVYIDKKDNQGFNALEVTVHGQHYKTLLKHTTRMYLVLEGKGIFTIDKETTDVKKGDLYIISHGQTYSYEGSMKLFEFNVPATDETNEEDIDEK